MRNKAKRILCLLLAILMVMGTVTWLITLIASADELAEEPASVVSAYRLDRVYAGRTNANNDNACYDKDDTDLNAYKIQRGYYADMTVSLQYTFKDNAEAAAFAGKITKVSLDSGSFSLDHNIDGDESEIEVSSSVTDKNVDVVLALTKVLYSGEGKNVGITLHNDGGFMTSHSISITQCVPYEAPTYSGDDDDEDDKPDIPSATPYVIVSGYNYGGGNVTAGQEFTLNLTIKNTSKLSVGNMTVTITTPEAFTLVNSSNTVYIETLGAGKTLTHSVKMMTRASANPEPAVVGVNFDYQYVADGSRHNVERAEQIAIPVTQLDRFQVEELVLPTQLWVGEEYDLEVKYVNKGRSTVYNLSAALQGEGLVEANQSEMVGNVESGKSGTIDFFLMTDMPGTLTGNVVVTYEDVNMNEKIITLPYSIEIIGMEEPVFEDPMAGIVYNEDGSYYGPDGILYGPDGMPMEENASGGWQTYAIIGGCVLAAAIVLIVVSKKRKAARLLAELEEDNNEDI